MESLVGEHDTVLAIKKCVTTKVENEEDEQQCSNYMETTESNLYIKSEEIDIKLEQIDYESIKSVQEEYLASKVEEDFNAIDNLKQEGIDIDENQLGLKNEADLEPEKTALPSISDAVLSSNPERGHTLVHTDTLENIISTFKTHPHVSKYTPNQGKRKSPKNKKSHKVSLKCEQCSYEAKCMSKLRVHLRVHKDPSELDMYKCTLCDFITKHKTSLRTHSITHKDAADMPRYKCNSCPFESNRKTALIRHIRLHQNTSGNILKCEQCSYKYHDPSLLHSHLYECTQCNFKTKYGRILTRHLILHHAVDKPRYKFNSCDFEGKRKGILRRHIHCHQSTSGNVLKCEQCLYKCHDPSLLRAHMRVHKDPSELDMYECTQCNFKTKHRASLANHSILHKDAADIPIYKCNSCHFENKRKSALIRHIRLHQKHGIF